MKIRWLLILSLALAAPLSFAQDAKPGKIYKWTDENGVVHYGGQPPEQGEAQEVRVRAEPVAPTPSDVAAADPQKAPDANDPCARARANLRLLQNEDEPVAIRDGTQIREITPAERKDQLTVAQITLQRCEEENPK